MVASEKYNQMQPLELLFIKDYPRNVILVKINKNIEESQVTSGEFITWLGTCFLMGTAFSFNRVDFSSKPIDNFAAVPFRVVKFMSKAAL